MDVLVTAIVVLLWILNFVYAFFRIFVCTVLPSWFSVMFGIFSDFRCCVCSSDIYGASVILSLLAFSYHLIITLCVLFSLLVLYCCLSAVYNRIMLFCCFFMAIYRGPSLLSSGLRNFYEYYFLFILNVHETRHPLYSSPTLN